MPTFTIVATTATHGSDEAELDTHIDEFENESEAVGYSRRIAEEMFGLAEQLTLDFDYSHVGVYGGDIGDSEPNTAHEAFAGMWVFEDEGVGYLTAAALREADAEAGVAGHA